jgi:hypothetical protein
MRPKTCVATNPESDLKTGTRPVRPAGWTYRTVLRLDRDVRIGVGTWSQPQLCDATVSDRCGNESRSPRREVGLALGVTRPISEVESSVGLARDPFRDNYPNR